MPKPFANRQIKRSKKDLGRAVALAFLADRQDENALEAWKPRWRDALVQMAQDQAEHLLFVVPSGLRALLDSPPDIEQALHTDNSGFLSATPMSADQFVIAMRRLLQAVS